MPTLDPMTLFFLGGIRQAALVELIERMGWHVDVFANSLDRAANEASGREVAEGEREALRQAVAIASEEARQLRLGRPKG